MKDWFEKVDDEVPTHGSKYPFRSMKVGECYKFNLEVVSRHSVWTAIRVARLKSENTKRFRTQVNGSSMRVWRVE